MTILQALSNYYQRLADRPGAVPVGYVQQQIGYALVLDAAGGIISVRPLGEMRQKKVVGTSCVVPAPVTVPKARTSGSIVPYFLWDKPSYLLGVETGETNTAKKFAASRKLHLGALANGRSPILVAVRKFFERYQSGAPESAIPDEYRDRPYVFRTEASVEFAHDTAEAKEIWSVVEPRVVWATGVCLVTGISGPVERLHPKIVGFRDADTLVAFDKEAFRSYGKEQGANAPVSRNAAHAYSTALNCLLRSGSRQRVQIGDTTVVFWADTSGVGEPAATAAEDVFGGWFLSPQKDDPEADAREAVKLRDALQALRQGRPLESLDLRLKDGTRFHVLGLAPNAARLSVRFWLTDDFAVFARRLADHHADLDIEPKPWGAKSPSIQRLLVKTVVPDVIRAKGSKASFEYLERNAPNLAGEVTRAVLMGARYPQSLLGATIIRLRAGDDASNGWHAAVIRAVLFRDQRLRRHDHDIPESGETPMSLKKDHPNKGYQLGRLFAVYELAQRSALRKVNATIRDKYFGAASAAPASVFPVIVRGAQNHLSKIRKEKPGWAYLIEKELEEIYSHIEPKEQLSLPRSLRLPDQGEFAIGYYHQRATKLHNDKGEQVSFDNIAAETEDQGDDE